MRWFSSCLRSLHQFDARLSQNFSFGNFSLTSNVISQCKQITQEHLSLEVDHAWNGLTPFWFSNLTKGISFSTRIPSSYLPIPPENFPPKTCTWVTWQISSKAIGCPEIKLNSSMPLIERSTCTRWTRKSFPKFQRSNFGCNTVIQ